jgi:hypothetical protein
MESEFCTSAEPPSNRPVGGMSTAQLQPGEHQNRAPPVAWLNSGGVAEARVIRAPFSNSALEHSNWSLSDDSAGSDDSNLHHSWLHTTSASSEPTVALNENMDTALAWIEQYNSEGAERDRRIMPHGIAEVLIKAADFQPGPRPCVLSPANMSDTWIFKEVQNAQGQTRRKMRASVGGALEVPDKWHCGGGKNNGMQHPRGRRRASHLHGFLHGDCQFVCAHNKCCCTQFGCCLPMAILSYNGGMARLINTCHKIAAMLSMSSRCLKHVAMLALTIQPYYAQTALSPSTK